MRNTKRKKLLIISFVVLLFTCLTTGYIYADTEKSDIFVSSDISEKGSNPISVGTSEISNNSKSGGTSEKSNNFESDATSERDSKNQQDQTEKIIDQQLQASDSKDIISNVKKYYSQDSTKIFPDFDPEKILTQAAKGDFKFSITDMLNRTVRYLLSEVFLNIDVLVKIIILAILCAILKNLQNSFLSESVGELAFFVCYIVIVSVLMVSFTTAMKMCMSIIDNMVSFMHAIIPLLISLLVSTGNISSAGIIQPLLIVLVEISATLIKNFFIPLVFLVTVLNIVNNISDKLQLTKLSGFIKQICSWGLGIILTVFIGIVSIQGSMGAVVDGVTSKTAKYALGTFIPVVGKYLADAADTVVGCTLVIKNASGIVAMIGVILVCLAPLLKILALVILYKLTSALVEPISDKKITNCLSDMAASLTYILGLTAAIAVMFLIAITVVINTTNLSAMIR